MTRAIRRRSRKALPVEAMTLASMLAALDGSGELSATRLRDLRSAVKCVANLLGDEPAALLLDIPGISCPAQHHQPPCGGHDDQAPRKHPFRLPSGDEVLRCAAGHRQQELEPRVGKAV